MNFRPLAQSLAALLLATSYPAQADELFVGVAAHQEIRPLAANNDEQGVDIQLGYRGERIEALAFIGKPAPYLLLSGNLSGDTSFAAAGLSWKFGDKIYLRPAIGLAIHDGPEFSVGPDRSQTQLGSRIVFEPELSVGMRLSETIDLEASWVHLSHGKIFNSVQNPGRDSVGLRLVVTLP